MDSLSVLQDSLDSSRPPAGPSKKHEKNLTQEFKAAALHLTNLYRGSLASSQQSYRSGYLQGLRDIVELLHIRSAQNGYPNVERDLFDDGADGFSAEAGPSRGPSQPELRWLSRYLQRRIEAIKSESDDEDNDMEDSATASRHPQPPQPTRSQPMWSESSSRSRARTEDRSQSPSSTAPVTPAHHSSTRNVRPMRGGPLPHDTLPASATRTPTRQNSSTSNNNPPTAAPSSATFSFNVANPSGMPVPPFSDTISSAPASDGFPPLPSTFSSTSSSSPQTNSRRRQRASSSPHAASAITPSMSATQQRSRNASAGSHLAPVPEESNRVDFEASTDMERARSSDREETGDDEDNDEEMCREERGSGTGRRGPPKHALALEGRPKRRRKTSDKKARV